MRKSDEAWAMRMLEAMLPPAGARKTALAKPDRRQASLTLGLQHKQMIGLEDCGNVEIHLSCGQLWITQSDDHRDIILQCDESFLLDRDGLALVTATQPSVVRLRPADASVLIRLRLE